MNKSEKMILIIRRLVPVFLLALVSAAMILVGTGRFSSIFDRFDRPVGGDALTPSGGDDLRDDEDIKNEEILGSLTAGDNISGIGDGGSKEDGTPSDSGDAPVDAPVKSEDEEYIPYERLEALMYHVTDADYIPGSGYVFIGELDLPSDVTRDHVSGSKTVTVDKPRVYEDGGEYFYYPVKTSDYRFKVETYMGYIIVADETALSIYRGDGTHITTLGVSECEPANRRDDSGNPLFIDGSNGGKYYYLDDSGRKVYVSNVTDRGLYFDYRASLGEPEGGLIILEKECVVNFHDEFDTSDYYILSSVNPTLAESIYASDASFAEKIARYNPRFKEALNAVKNAPKPAVTTAETTENTTDIPVMTTEAAEPSEDDTEIISDSAVDIESGAESDTVIDAESTTAVMTETEKSPETDTETTAADITEEVSTETDIGTDTAKVPETLPETEQITEPEPEQSYFTAEKNGKILTIDRSELLPRYAYAFADTDPDTLVWKYALCYPYSEGRAAVVDDNGVLRYIDGEGNVVIDGTGTKMVTSSRYITVEYALPNIKNSEMAKGYIYFDEGLVRVRKLERDYTFRNLIYSDSDVLLYADGSEYDIPEGFTLEAYSEGVLVLKSSVGKYGYYHKDGYWIAQPIYTSIKPFSEGLGVLGFEGGKKGVIDKAGNVVVPFSYEYITSMSSGVMTLYDYNCETGWRILVKAGV